MGNETEATEAFENGFYDLPSQKELSKMNIVQIAGLMFNEKNHDSVKYIVLAHELNMKIVKAQNAATMASAKIGFLGVLIGLFFGWLLG